jgi:hypothetical protein
MTTALSLLVLLGFVVADPATAAPFDIFSLSAVIRSPAAENFFRGSASLAAEAYPNIKLFVGIVTASPGAGYNLAVLRCSRPVPGFPYFSESYDGPCRPGDKVYAVASGVDYMNYTNGSLSMPGTNVSGPCGISGGPQQGPGPPISGACGVFNGDAFFTPVVLPPFTGTTEISVATAFSASAGVGIRQFDAAAASAITFVGSVGFSGSGLGEFDLVWLADKQAWLPLRAEGYIAATPEPATLLLWGTSAAGLGLARWYRRRAHSA